MKLLKKDIKDLATVSNYSANRFAADFGRDNNTNFKYDYENEGKALAENPEIDAIFTSTDVLVNRTIKYWNEVGIILPRQIAIFGFNRWFISFTQLTRQNLKSTILFDDIYLKK